MNKIIANFAVGIALLFGCVSLSQAQIRSQEMKRSDYSGQILKKSDPSDGANISNLFNMKMSQSYSMNFAMMGGQTVNLNAYTNSMQFFFTPKLTGQVDVSLLHSPFGKSSFYNFGNDNEKELQVALDAQLDYQITKNMNIHFEVNRAPGGYGYGYYPGSYASQYGPFLGY